MLSFPLGVWQWTGSAVVPCRWRPRPGLLPQISCFLVKVLIVSETLPLAVSGASCFFLALLKGHWRMPEWGHHRGTVGGVLEGSGQAPPIPKKRGEPLRRGGEGRGGGQRALWTAAGAPFTGSLPLRRGFLFLLCEAASYWRGFRTVIFASGSTLESLGNF